jgi:uncharacterized repeat protein (TIGR03803 family)
VAPVRLGLEPLEDRTAPAGLTVSLTSPANGSLTNNSKPTLTATASDVGGPGLASIQFQYSIDGGRHWHNVGAAETSEPFSVTFPSSLADGTYQVRAIATDNAGHSAISDYSQTPLTLASFDGAAGGSPAYDLVGDDRGNLFGTTTGNGASGVNVKGTVFEVVANSGIVTTLASFNGANGAYPAAGLVRDRSGNLYGTTTSGGANNLGTVFELAANSGTITTLASFAIGLDTGSPDTRLVRDSNGNLFGTSGRGLIGSHGTVFEVAAGSGVITTIASFNSTNGYDSHAGLVEDGSGNLFGVTDGGGANDLGTVFKVAAGSGGITTLASFNGSNGANPRNAGLFEDSSGNLFGTTLYGGAHNQGTVFEVAAGTGTITTLASFAGANGANPVGGVVEDSNGNLFGVTNTGGEYGYGTVFELAAGTDTITALASFDSANGVFPRGQLVEDRSGSLLGITTAGGANGYGTVFQLAATPVSFTIDTVAPAVSLTAPASGSFTSNNEPTLSATAADDASGSGLASVQLQYRSTGAPTWNNVGTAQAGGPFSFTFTWPLSDGVYEARAIATDKAGNSRATAARSFTVDDTRPAVRISAPATSLVSGTCVITYTIIYDETNFDHSTLAVGDLALNKTSTANATVNVGAGGGATRKVTLTNVSGNGTLGISLAPGTAVDKAGNLANAPSSSSAAVTIQAPKFTSAKSAAFTAGSPVRFQLSASGAPSAVRFSLIGAPNWLSVNVKNQLVGPLPVVGTVPYALTFKIGASNGVLPNDTQIPFTLIVNPPIRFVPAALPSYTLYSPYLQTIVTAGGTGTINFSYTTTAPRPTGLDLRVIPYTKYIYLITISGIPVRLGTVTITIKAIDSTGAESDTIYTLTGERTPT